MIDYVSPLHVQLIKDSIVPRYEDIDVQKSDFGLKIHVGLRRNGIWYSHNIKGPKRIPCGDTMPLIHFLKSREILFRRFDTND